MTRARVLRADALLLFVALIWGVGFVVQKSAMAGDDPIGPIAFAALRLLIGGLVLLPLLWLDKRMPPTRVATLKNRIIAVCLAGVLLAGGGILQQWGLVYTQAGVAAFVTGLYVVLVPLLGLLIGYHVRRTIWMAAVLAVVGMYLLSVAGRPTFNPGDLLILGSAVCWAGQVLVIGWIASSMGPIKLTMGQNIIGGLLAVTVAAIVETTTWAQVVNVAWELAYSGPLAIGLGFLLQIMAQRDAPPAHTAILLAMEAVFGAMAGWLLLHEAFTPTMLVGCTVVLIAMGIAQLKLPKTMVTA
jgi:drug/metabolite transporter (DMT)-like permease